MSVQQQLHYIGVSTGRGYYQCRPRILCITNSSLHYSMFTYTLYAYLCSKQEKSLFPRHNTRHSKQEKSFFPRHNQHRVALFYVSAALRRKPSYTVRLYLIFIDKIHIIITYSGPNCVSCRVGLLSLLGIACTIM